VTYVSPYAPARLVVEVEHGGRRELREVDAGADRRVIIGRGDSCEIRIDAAVLSRKHAMLLCTDAGWQLHDLQSSNGIELNGVRVEEPRALSPGDVFGIGELRIRFVDGTVPMRQPNPLRVVVDLDGGRALIAGEALPISAAELIWFAWLAVHRATGDGWVVAGADGHAAFGAFAAALLYRPWGRAVKTRPLLDLAHGREVDDEDLKNLRGKTAQKLRAFCTGGRGWLAPLLVPEVSGKHLQRLPLAPGLLDIIGRP
jgi:hypothetical protein